MQIQLTNTLSRQKEIFVPQDPTHVRMYVCGPTVYDRAHLGNARPVVVFDTLYRLLKRHFPRVTYARNITDIDDKIIVKHQQTGEAIESITTRTTADYHADMAALNALSPDIEPRATAHVAEMIALIEILLERQHAYVAEGHVLFHVPSMPNYGALSRRNHDEILAGARVDVAPYKKDPSDFVLWKPSPADYPGWDSPWGRGRPGWHIECSAMAKKHLGVSFDIHGGGLDLIFPHHENEIAQSCCAHAGAPLATYWLHNGFLTINNDKMSKSLGNFLTVQDVLGHAPGEAVRFALLSAHYRQPLDFTLDKLAQAKQTLDRWYGALRDLPHDLPIAEPDAAVESALADDLNTPAAFAVLHELVSQLNKTTERTERLRLAASLRASAGLLGLLQQESTAWFSFGQENAKLSLAEAQAIAKQIDEARRVKNWELADNLRKSLTDNFYIVSSAAAGTQVKLDSSRIGQSYEVGVTFNLHVKK